MGLAAFVHLLVRALTPAKKGSRFFASLLGIVGSLLFKTSLLALPPPPLDLPLLDLPPERTAEGHLRPGGLAAEQSSSLGQLQ